ncbi:molybdopterin dinucleotide binding domain-containing protein, partial [Aquabacterium sp. UBA2148]|uniref:molybdopterin dinucleotide binding domain-containing protein n=1 Tax=Aquabacterium sp. UBA2148 TaxID=1946042 RepID=UPI00257B1C2E
ALERLADLPIYSADALVRRSPSLQATADAKAPVASLPPALWAELGLSEGAQVKVSQDSASAVLPAVLDASLPANVVRVPTGHAATATLGAAFGNIRVEKA